MSETKHTPGPWRYERGNDFPFTVTTAEDGPWGICEVHDDCDAHRGDYKQEVEANARLIASAPELLDALQAVLNAGRGVSGRIILDRQDEEAVRAAIARATGKP